jgi:glycogen operon protein
MLRLAQPGGADDVVYAAFNMYWEPLTFGLPAPPGRRKWHCFANTGLASPDDVAEVGKEPLAPDQHEVELLGRSVLVLTAR